MMTKKDKTTMAEHLHSTTLMTMRMIGTHSRTNLGCVRPAISKLGLCGLGEEEQTETAQRFIDYLHTSIKP